MSRKVTITAESAAESVKELARLFEERPEPPPASDHPDSQVIGIDPGLGGAIAVAYKGNFDVWDMPVLEVKQKRWVSAAMLADLLLSIRTKDTRVLLERVSARPGQGVTSMFSFGMGYGIVQGVVAALEMPLSFVTPQEWRRIMKVPPGKDGSRQRVLELHPEFASQLTRKRDHGRADALLIAIFGSQ